MSYIDYIVYNLSTYDINSTAIHLPMSNLNKKYSLIYYDSIDQKDVSWLFYPYIPYGKITIVQGDPGEGKTTLMLQIAAMLTTGRSIPDGGGTIEPRNVIFQGAEDGNADTIKPRLIRAGADCSRIAFISTDYSDDLSIGDVRFRKAIEECNAGLLIIDPIQAFIRRKADEQTANSMRAAFSNLAMTAEETGCAVVMIGHLNKGSGKGIYRGLGSIDVAAAARSILMVGRDKDDPTIRVMAPVKSSLAPEGSSYAFRIDDGGFHWIGKHDASAEELLSGGGLSDRKLERAKACLMMVLQSGDVISNDIFDQLKGIGIGKRTVETAKQELGILSYKEGKNWYWHLPDPGREQ